MPERALGGEGRATRPRSPRGEAGAGPRAALLALPPPRRRVAAPPPMAIAEGAERAAAPQERRRGGARGHLSPPLPAGHGDASPAVPQPFCRLASPLGDVKASGLPPPALHVEAVVGILKRLGDARRHAATGHRHFRAVRVVSWRKNAAPWPLASPRCSPERRGTCEGDAE